MESGHFIDASSAAATLTTASGTVVVGGTGISQSGGGGGVPKVAYQVSRVVPIASAAVTQSQLHPVAGEISNVEDDGDGGSQTTSGGTIQAVLTNGLNGQFYVIGNPSDVLGARTIAPRGGVMAGGAERAVSSSSERRRATHNEVERRRRDTINNMIMKLGKLIPDLFNPETGPPKNNTLSKGGILARACEYVTEMRQSNQSLKEKAAKAEKLLSENEKLQHQLDAMKQENELLRQHLDSNGILVKKVDNILTDSNS